MHFVPFMAIPYCNLTEDNIEVQRGEILAVAEECHPEEIVEEPSIDGLTDDDQDLVHCNQLQVLEPKEDLDPETEAKLNEKIRLMIKDAILKSECPEQHIPSLQCRKYLHCPTVRRVV